MILFNIYNYKKSHRINRGLEGIGINIRGTKFVRFVRAANFKCVHFIQPKLNIFLQGHTQFL